MYQVVYDAKTKIDMTKEEVQKFLLALQDQEVVEFKGEFLTKFFRVIAKKEITEGRLHDGTRVIKRFDQWVDKHNPDLKLDYSYYPELATDEIMSEEEYSILQSKQQYLLENTPESIKECKKCEGTGEVDHSGNYTYSPWTKKCDCYREAIKNLDETKLKLT